MEERTLSAAQFYCGKTLENAHQQSGYHSDLRNIKSAIRPLSRTRKRYEITIRIYYKKKLLILQDRAFDKDDEEIYFGKHKV
jgi:hypothetical protein